MGEGGCEKYFAKLLSGWFRLGGGVAWRGVPQMLLAVEELHHAVTLTLILKGKIYIKGTESNQDTRAVLCGLSELFALT